MLLVLGLLSGLGTRASSSGVLARAVGGGGLLSRLIMAMSGGMGILIQTVVVLVALFLILSSFLGCRAVLRAPDVTGSCGRIAFVFAVHFVDSGAWLEGLLWI